MLEENFARVYRKFRMQLYAKVLRSLEMRGENSLSPQEVIYMEIISTMGSPTVNEFARYAGISPPNAAYRVGQLVQKGYVEKYRDGKDRREYHLKKTEKYDRNFNDVDSYIKTVCDRIRERFSKSELEQFDHMLEIISSELMTDRDTLRSLALMRR